MLPQDQIDRAHHDAAELALENGIEALMTGAINPEIGGEVLADLLAHELTAIHRLMMLLTGKTHGVLDWCVNQEKAAREAALPAPDTDLADRAAARLAGVASRLMETMRQGLVALARLRPEAVGEGKWIALSTLDGRCSEEELLRRIAALKAARAANDPAPREPAPSRKAQELRILVERDALELAAEAGVETMAPLAADAGLGVAFLARLLGHELGAEHGLMMRLAGSANLAFERAAADQEPAVALALSGTVARLADRFRRAVLTLQRLQSGPGGPGKVNLVWGGIYGADAPDAAPANDTPEPLAAPAVPAGHGVDRSESNVGAAPCGHPLPPPHGGASASGSAVPAGHGVDRSEIQGQMTDDGTPAVAA